MAEILRKVGLEISILSRIVLTIKRIALLLACAGSAHALTPLPDSSPGFFAGEWSGIGEHGRNCYLTLHADGWGWVLIDAGTGDWLGARMQWRNQKQALTVERIVPLAASPQRRVMPLTKFELRGGFNQSLVLTWQAAVSGCHLQKVEVVARHLERARDAMQSLPENERAR